MRKSLPKVLVVLILAVAAAGIYVHGQATKPADDLAAKLHSVTPAAQTMLDTMRDAYGKLKSLQLTGSLSLTLDAAGQKENDHSDFTASFQAPNQFRHEMKDDLLLVSNGEKGFVYKADTKKYATIDPIKDRMDVSDLPYPITDELQQQNPSLLMALVKNPGDALFEGPGVVDVAPDATVNGEKLNVLRFSSSGREMRVLIDPKTHLIRQETVDLKQRMIDHGVPQVNAAAISIDYSKSVTDAPIELASFNWTPPADALLVRLSPEAENPEDVNPAAVAMQGQAAPDFKLQDLDGKTVTLSEQKGKVVVLDFWATWCPPCVESLPHWDALNKELGDKGVRVFAVNRQEAKPQIEQFLKENKLTVPVLLDPDDKAGSAFKVTPIPHTVLIGKDGKIIKVGFGIGIIPGSLDEFRQAIDQALKS